MRKITKINLTILLCCSSLVSRGQQTAAEVSRPSKSKEEVSVAELKYARCEAKKSKSSARAATENKLLYLNGANFDFTGKLAVNYVGHLNIFAPEGAGRWGFNAGIMKLNYGSSDTLHESYSLENVLIDPLRPTLVNGDKYLKQLNKYTVKPKTTVWSFYAQPLYNLKKVDGGGNAIYLHAHLELLVNNYSASISRTNILSDTFVFNNDKNFVARANITDQSNYQKARLDGYFGGGLTFNLAPYENGVFFFQPTIGVTTDYPQIVNGNAIPISIAANDNNWRNFYLIRAYYIQKLSDNSSIVIGSDIRGMFPRYEPRYATYIGLNLGVDKLKELIVGTSNEKTDNPEEKKSQPKSKQKRRANSSDDDE